MAKKRPAPAPTAVITASMPIMDIITYCPAARPVLAEYGLNCVGCAGSTFETLEEGCLGHGFSREEIADLVTDINDMIKDMPARPRSITVTLPGARAIKEVMAGEGRADDYLEVIADEGGGFCLEFQTEVPDGWGMFFHPEEPGVRIVASDLTLNRIGGATIDFRDGKFKLDLPEDAQCGCASGSCACKDGGKGDSGTDSCCTSREPGN